MKPSKQIVPLAVGLAWQAGGLFQQKLDGKFALRKVARGALAGEDVRGNVALFGGRCDRVRVGSLVKIEGFGLYASGLIREPRPCKDTPDSWLIQF